MSRAGQLERVAPGRYRLPGKSPTEHHDLVVTATAIPVSVVCLVSALHFHGIGTQLPHQVWIAVPRGTRVPRLTSPPIRVVNISTAVFDIGIEEHRVEGHVVRVYGVARTVADCFRFRNTVGLDVALEALSEAWRGKRLNLDELNRIAKRLRVQRVMQPYLETVVL
jgi:predicted transcriptional regulator of viral defense system